MYDYRNDLIQLLLKTKDTPDSLAQTALALGIISRSLFSEKASVLDDGSLERVKSLIEKEKESTEKPAVRTVVKKPVVATDVKTEPVKPIKKIVIKKPEVVITDPLEKARRALPAGQYLIIDKLSGCVAQNKRGEDVAYFTESVKRNKNLEHGDIVTLTHEDGTDKYYIKSIISKADIPSNITVFTYAKIEKDMLGLYVSRNVNNEQLSNVNKKHTRFNFNSVVISKFSLKEGDFIDLAWYNSTPDQIMVIWKYDMNTIVSTPVIKPKKHSEYTAKAEQPAKEVKPKIDFDLDGKKVALVTADDSVSGKAEEIVTLHNGVGAIVEANNGGRVLDRLSSYDIIILLQNYISHEVTRPIIAQLKDTKAIALAENAGQLSLEKALYRANNDLGVNDQDFIPYPMVNDDEKQIICLKNI